MSNGDTQYEVDSGLRESLDDQEGDLAPVISGIQEWITDELANQDATCTKCSRRVNNSINRQSAANANQLDSVLTKLLAWIDQQQQSHDWQLGQIAAKAGLLVPGQGLAEINWDPEPESQHMVLDCRNVEHCMRPLIEVLREIRDRFPGPPAKDVATAMADTEEDEADSDGTVDESLQPSNVEIGDSEDVEFFDLGPEDMGEEAA